MKRYKIILSLILALIIASIASKTVFIANTPKINKELIARLVNTRPKNVSTTFSSSTKGSSNKIAPGVYAKEEGNVTVFEFKEDEIEWVEYVFTLKDGRTIKVEVPKGQEPPPKEIFE